MPENTGDARPLLLGGARLTDGRLVDVRIAGRHIEAVGTAGSLTTRGTRLDLRGHLLLPAPAEPHAQRGDAGLVAEGGEVVDTGQAHHPPPCASTATVCRSPTPTRTPAPR
ncbi:hypothetical protein AB0K87_11740, partial [Streptomyces sp. NPDC053705]